MTNLVAVDFDSTIYDLTACLARLSGDTRHLNPTDWDHCRTVCGSDEAFEILLAEAIKLDAMLDHIPFIGSIEELRFLQQKGFEVAIISDRPEHNQYDVGAYLKYYGLEVERIFLMRGAEKVSWCLKNGARLLVDDRPSTLEESVNRGLPVASLRHGYNADVIEMYGIPHGYTWAGLSKEINTILGVE